MSKVKGLVFSLVICLAFFGVGIWFLTRNDGEAPEIKPVYPVPSCKLQNALHRSLAGIKYCFTNLGRRAYKGEFLYELGWKLGGIF